MGTFLAMIFTFHYVSISTYIPEVETEHHLHLHSTMYLFQLAQQRAGIPYKSIYIPLCIYFNHLQQKSTVIPLPNLHSTMYLFQLSVICYTLKLNIIYIPLCIYFNRKAPGWAKGKIKIYIPLCIYFNIFKFLHRKYWFLFTFHYVSISTPMSQINPLTNN